MAGSYLRITASNTANKGDGAWYEIDSFTSTTVIELVKGYEGTAITAGAAAYTIGQVPLLPENHQMLPVYYAIHQYYLDKGEMNRSDRYEKLFDDGISDLLQEHAANSDSLIISRGNRRRRMENNNNYISSI